MRELCGPQQKPYSSFTVLKPRELLFPIRKDKLHFLDSSPVVVLVLQITSQLVPSAGADAEWRGQVWLETQGRRGSQVSFPQSILDSYFLIGWKDTSNPVC